MGSENYELIRQHQKDCGGCSVWHHMQGSSSTYQQIKEKGDSIIPDIIEYLKNNDCGMSVLHLLEEKIPHEQWAYHPNKLSDSGGMAGWNVGECKRAWIEWWDNKSKTFNQ